VSSVSQEGSSVFHDQYEFLQAGDVEQFTSKSEQLAFNLIEEEYCEFINTDSYLGEYANSEAIKEALDLMYVTAQYLNVTIGPDKAKLCWDALHANNMSKCVEGKLVKRDDGKVEKPDGFKKLDLSTVLCDNT
jgi:predicted HAD superfamily Cof-like phosphohydrolase